MIFFFYHIWARYDKNSIYRVSVICKIIYEIVSNTHVGQLSFPLLACYSLSPFSSNLQSFVALFYSQDISDVTYCY